MAVSDERENLSEAGGYEADSPCSLFIHGKSGNDAGSNETRASSCRGRVACGVNVHVETTGWSAVSCEYDLGNSSVTGVNSSCEYVSWIAFTVYMSSHLAEGNDSIYSAGDG